MFFPKIFLLNNEKIVQIYDVFSDFRSVRMSTIEFLWYKIYEPFVLVIFAA